MKGPSRRSVALGALAALTTGRADAVGLLSIVKSPPTNPSIASLPVAAPSPGNWNSFPGASWAINTPFTDTTGAVMRRITDANSPVANLGVNMEYATGGPRISRPFGTNLDTYHVCALNGANGGGSESVVIFDVQRGLGFVSGSYKTTPTLPNGIIGYCWSQRSTEPHILFFSDKTSPDLIHRYDVNAGAYAPNSVFSGTNASIAAGGNIAGWLTQNWAGNHMIWVTPTSSPTALHFLNLDTGVLTNYTGSQVSNANDIRLCKGSANVATCANNDGTKSFWFVDTNVVTSEWTSASAQGHSDMGAAYYYVWDSDDANYPLLKVTVGTAPVSDGGAATASEVALYNAGSGAQTMSQDSLPNMNWDQTGAGSSEWYCTDTDTGQSNLLTGNPTANGWSVDSGSVYKTAVTFAAHYGETVRGVNAVIRLNGSGTYIGTLTLAASRVAMTAGTFFWDSGTTTLYAWMADSSTPSGFTALKSSAKLDESIGYAKADGSDIRKLCNTYRNQKTWAYEMTPFTNWSPDGKFVLFGSNFGVNAGRVDLVMCEVPLA